MLRNIVQRLHGGAPLSPLITQKRTRRDAAKLRRDAEALAGTTPQPPQPFRKRFHYVMTSPSRSVEEMTRLIPAGGKPRPPSLAFAKPLTFLTVRAPRASRAPARNNNLIVHLQNLHTAALRRHKTVVSLSRKPRSLHLVFTVSLFFQSTNVAPHHGHPVISSRPASSTPYTS